MKRRVSSQVFVSTPILNVKFTLNIQKIYLTYLRGLEIAELKEEDMPMV